MDVTEAVEDRREGKDGDVSREERRKLLQLNRVLEISPSARIRSRASSFIAWWTQYKRVEGPSRTIADADGDGDDDDGGDGDGDGDGRCNEEEIEAVDEW